MEERDLIVCEECGSTEIQTQAWVDANNAEYLSDVDDDDTDCKWCNLSKSCDKAHYP